LATPEDGWKNVVRTFGGAEAETEDGWKNAMSIV
jgi:hypothetical protein